MADRDFITPEPDRDAAQLRHDAMEYWKSDGIPDLVSGVAFTIFFGSIICTWRFIHGQPTGDWGWLVGSLGLASLPLGFVFLVWFSNSREEIIERIKARLTYPRTGYVAPPSHWEQIPREKSAVALWFDRHPTVRFARGLIFFFAFLYAVASFPTFKRNALWIWLAWAILPSLFEELMIVRRNPKKPAPVEPNPRSRTKNKLFWINLVFLPTYLGLIVLFAVNHNKIGVILVFMLGPGLSLIIKGALFLAWYIHRHPLVRT